MAITLVTAQDRGHFAALRRLMDEMAEWDAAMTEAAGYPGFVVATAYYGESAADLRRAFTAPGAAMVLARDGRSVIGCLGYSARTAAEAEVQKFFVRPVARRTGTGGRLLAEVMVRMRSDGYRTACLETATFMAGAIRTYQAEGFVACPPFRAPPPGLDGLSVFLRSSL